MGIRNIDALKPGEPSMTQYRRKPALTEAHQWFKNGDHPKDRSILVERPNGPSALSEGLVVKFFRGVHIPGDRFCPECGNIMQKHGLLAKQGEHDEEIVHPGDYIVQHPQGHYYVMRSNKFEELFEPYEVTPTPPPAVTEPKPKPEKPKNDRQSRQPA